MSHSRSARRKIERTRRNARAEELIRESDESPIVFVGGMANFDVFRRGQIAFIVPRLDDSMPDEVKRAIQSRRDASLSGVCPVCGARRGRFRVQADGEASHGAMRHEADCIVGEGPMRELLARHGWTAAS